VERAVILAEAGQAIDPELLGLGPASFPSHSSTRSGVQSVNGETGVEANASGVISTMEEIERKHILHALESTGGNRTKTAELLEINVRTLRNKIRQYKLEGEEVP
jgi:DNA-binding NtrC family response regulator